MKTLRKSLFAFAAIALLSTTAHAQTVVVHFVGSNTDRSATYNALAHILTNPTAVYIGSNLASANDSAWQGTLAGTTYQVECHWAGAVTGIVGLTAPATNKYNFQPYLSSGTAVTAGGQSNFFSPFGLLPGVGGGHQLASSGSVTNPDIASADVGTSVSFQTTAAQVPGAYAAVTASTLTDLGPVSVIPFAFVKSAAQTTDGDYTAYTHVTDITGIAAQTLYATADGVSAQLLTGNTSDAQAFLYPVGRDIDSGARIAAFAETGFGVGTTPVQYSVNTVGGAAPGPDATVASLTPFPNASFPTLGQGYSSGTNIATALEVSGWDNPNLPNFDYGYGIGYLGAADTDTAVTAGFQITAAVTFNGTSTTFIAAGTTGSNVTQTIAAGDNVYLVSSTAASQAIPATPFAQVSSASGTSVTLNAAPAAGTYTVLIDTLPASYIRPQVLTFNGVPLTQANVNNGKYQFWEYTHIYIHGGSSPSALVSALLSDLSSTDAKVSGYLLSTMTPAGGAGTTAKAAEGKPIHF
jgi:hypothetical protein